MFAKVMYVVDSIIDSCYHRSALRARETASLWVAILSILYSHFIWISFIIIIYSHLYIPYSLWCWLKGHVLDLSFGKRWVNHEIWSNYNSLISNCVENLILCNSSVNASSGLAVFFFSWASVSVAVSCCWQTVWILRNYVPNPCISTKITCHLIASDEIGSQWSMEWHNIFVFIIKNSRVTQGLYIWVGLLS